MRTKIKRCRYIIDYKGLRNKVIVLTTPVEIKVEVTNARGYAVYWLFTANPWDDVFFTYAMGEISTGADGVIHQFLYHLEEMLKKGSVVEENCVEVE